MCTDRNPIFCIVPPEMFKKMAESRDRRLRELALRMLTSAAHLRGRREILGRIRTTMLGTTSGEKHRTIYDAQQGTALPGPLARDEGEPESTDPAVNEAYDGLGATYDLFAEVYNRNSIDDRGMRLLGTVHYAEGYNNAFWDGERMVFGDGDGEIFVGFTKAIDVIGHELTHGVTQFTSGLEYEFQSGALNESFSDVFGALVKQHHLGQTAAQADWLIGKGIMGPTIQGEALRSMKAPGTAYDDPRLGKDPQPDHMNKFVELPLSEDQGGVHINSGIPNHAFYLVAKQLGGNAWEEAGTIWYNALLQLWATAQFQDCANITAQVAGAQFGTNSPQQQAVKEAWAAVGVKVAKPHAARTRRRAAVGRAAARVATAVEGNGNAFRDQLQRLSDEIRRTIESIAAPAEEEVE